MLTFNKCVLESSTKGTSPLSQQHCLKRGSAMVNHCLSFHKHRLTHQHSGLRYLLLLITQEANSVETYINYSILLNINITQAMLCFKSSARPKHFGLTFNIVLWPEGSPSQTSRMQILSSLMWAWFATFNSSHTRSNGWSFMIPYRENNHNAVGNYAT